MSLKCLCGTRLTAHPTLLSQWLCHSCWKLQSSHLYYRCGKAQKCANPVGNKSYKTPESCYAEVQSYSNISIRDKPLDQEKRIMYRLEFAMESISWVVFSVSGRLIDWYREFVVFPQSKRLRNMYCPVIVGIYWSTFGKYESVWWSGWRTVCPLQHILSSFFPLTFIILSSWFCSGDDHGSRFRPRIQRD